MLVLPITMTAEIVIMNRSAVALAADSAVTIRDKKSRGKIFNTANKVFALSKHAPVGILVSGGASVMGVPWETMVKKFRKELKNGICNTVEEYCDLFFNFVDSFPFEAEAEELHVQRIANSILDHFIERRTALTIFLIKSMLRKKERKVLSEVNEVLQLEIARAASFFTEVSDKLSIDKDTLTQFHTKYCDLLDDLIKQFVKQCSVSKESQENLRSVVICAAHINPRFSPIVLPHSGIAIAGFGENEYFPCCMHYDVGGVVFNRTICFQNKQNSCSIGVNSEAAILPFAQSDEIWTFLNGVSPFLFDVIHKAFQKFFGSNGALVKKLFNGLRGCP